MKNINKIMAFILVFAMFFSLFLTPAYSEQSGIFSYRVSGGKAVLTGIKSTFSGAVLIPETLGGYPVCTIDGAFRYMTRITSVTMPDSVTQITDNSFAYCAALESVSFSSNLSAIGECAFQNCNSLETVEIPDSVTSIGAYAFSWCENLTSVTLPENISIIKEGLFEGCTSLSVIEIPDNVSRVEANALSNTGYYNDAGNWENRVLYCGKCLLSAKSDLSGRYEVKKGTKVIANSAFASCASLNSIVFYDELKTVGYAAFRTSSYLTDVYYSGTYAQRQEIYIGGSNSYLADASWHYGYCLAGDITDDGKVNNKDLLRLFKYLSHWSVDVKEALLDVNGDGTVNNKDLTRLFQYLSGWNVRIFYKNANGESGSSPGGDNYGPIISF